MSTPAPTLESFGDQVIAQLVAERARRRWTQAQMAARLGREQQWIQRRETGATRIDLDDLAALADVFGMTPDELLLRARRDSNPKPSDPKSDVRPLKLIKGGLGRHRGSQSRPALQVVR